MHFHEDSPALLHKCQSQHWKTWRQSIVCNASFIHYLSLQLWFANLCTCSQVGWFFGQELSTCPPVCLWKVWLIHHRCLYNPCSQKGPSLECRAWSKPRLACWQVEQSFWFVDLTFASLESAEDSYLRSIKVSLTFFAKLRFLQAWRSIWGDLRKMESPIAASFARGSGKLLHWSDFPHPVLRVLSKPVCI